MEEIFQNTVATGELATATRMPASKRSILPIQLTVAVVMLIPMLMPPHSPPFLQTLSVRLLNRFKAILPYLLEIP